MKRRDVLKGAAATAVLPVGALAGAAENPKPNYEEKYWDAQRHIDGLYANQYKVTGFYEDQNLQLHTGKGSYLEITSQGDDVVLTNPKTGRVLVL